jgi:hypothetical protein
LRVRSICFREVEPLVALRSQILRERRGGGARGDVGFEQLVHFVRHADAHDHGGRDNRRGRARRARASSGEIGSSAGLAARLEPAGGCSSG